VETQGQFPLTKEEKKAVKKHLRDVKKLLFQNLVSAYRGWWLWHKLTKKYKKHGGSNWAYILLPDTNERDNYLSLLYLEQMLSHHKFSKAVILTHNAQVHKLAPLFPAQIAEVVECSRIEALQLIQFYCLYNFDIRFFCAALDEPYGRDASKLIGVNGISAEEIFAIGVYRIYPYAKELPPALDNADEALVSFIKRAAQAAEEGYIEESDVN